MTARIYRPAKTAMSSGQAKTHVWVLEFEPSEAKSIDPLMGWNGNGDTDAQVKLSFESKEAAIAYARKHGIPFQVFSPQERKPTVRPRGYGENFSYNRRGAWTH
ncbi:MAG: ETC complex I subunit [Pseudomonadota bacterium]